jgi:hypothetical protein
MKFKIFIAVLVIVSVIIVVTSTNNISDAKFNSHRLGNVIDQWYTSAKFPDSGNYRKMIEKDPPNKSKDSFSQYLIRNVRTYENTISSVNRNTLERQVKGGFLTYYYDRIVLCVDDFHSNLSKIMQEYDEIHNNVLTKQAFNGPSHCILHFRLGDYVSLGDVIDYSCTIDAMQKLNIPLSTIELMDGGKSHNSPMFSSFQGFKNYFSNNELSESEKISSDLIQALEAAFPESKIVQSEKRTSDEDFYRMAAAPILVTAGGSFAITAAIGGSSRIVRTPACKTLDFPSKGCGSQMTVPKTGCDWQTYSYKML